MSMRTRSVSVDTTLGYPVTNWGPLMAATGQATQGWVRWSVRARVNTCAQAVALRTFVHCVLNPEPGASIWRCSNEGDGHLLIREERRRPGEVAPALLPRRGWCLHFHIRVATAAVCVGGQVQPHERQAHLVAIIRRDGPRACGVRRVTCCVFAADANFTDGTCQRQRLAITTSGGC